MPSVSDPFFHETDARKTGFDLIAGVDEAGRGPLAGPVTAAAVILPEGLILPGIKDSKQMTEKTREKAFSVIHHKALAVSVGVVSHRFIDEFNILEASLEAMKRAVLSLRPAAEYLLVDGIQTISVPITQKCLKKGDQRSMSISAASVIAKVYRDRIMRSYDERFPEYGFLTNKGYGTQKHMTALRRYGPCPIHRLTFKGVLEGK
ncbi:MAG: ribonuclease HII [Deltaproteobacteria bacterium]|nr:ribonuclease HII [Deltaproteobacteria bacterium]